MAEPQRCWARTRSSVPETGVGSVPYVTSTLAIMASRTMASAIAQLLPGSPAQIRGQAFPSDCVGHEAAIAFGTLRPGDLSGDVVLDVGPAVAIGTRDVGLLGLQLDLVRHG